MKNIFILSFFITIISCNKESDVKKNIDFFQASEFGSFGSKTRIVFYANFDECGEWGGHKESFEIFAKSDREFYTTYKRTKVDCSKIAKLYGKPEFHQPYINKEIKLSDKQKIAINNYLSQLVISKIRENNFGNSGQRFGVTKSDSTLIIDVYGNDIRNLDNYNKLLSTFNLQKVEYKNE